MVFHENLIFPIISVLVTLSIFFIIKAIIRKKLGELKGTKKLLGIITIGIVVSELIYLGFEFRLFQIAAEIIASIGVAFALVVWALQNNLKNAVAGIEIYLNPEIDIGDIIEIEDKKGVIIELHLTKIVALTDDGVRVFIPCQKIVDDVTCISHSPRKK